MLASFMPVLILLGFAAAFPAGLLILTSILGPKVKTAAKLDAYECGVPAVGSPEDATGVRFYRVAILFLLFDVEAALLFPWAVVFREMLPTWGPRFLVAEFVVFLLILIVGYLYAWYRGALEWD